MMNYRYVAKFEHHLRSLKVRWNRPFAAEARKGAKDAGGDESKSDKAETEMLKYFFEKSEEASSSKIDFTDAELDNHKVIAKEYQKQFAARHRRMEKDLTDKIYLQQAALKALPPNLLELAQVVDETPPPADRPWPIWATPPIKGFNARDYMEKSDDDDDLLSNRG